MLKHLRAGLHLPNPHSHESDIKGCRYYRTLMLPTIFQTCETI